MTSITAIQDQEVTFISGVDATGVVAPISYGTWNYDSPPTYDGSAGYNYSAKFGPATSGTGATISYAFDLASNWTAAEKAAFVATAELWSAVANVSFVQAPRQSAQVVLRRSTDDSASGGQTATAAATGTHQLGVATAGSIDIDTSVATFGPLGTSLSNYGGYPYTVLIHEWGHVLGLGHGGPYNEGDVDANVYTAFDNRAWTVMSYNDQAADWGVSRGDNNLFYGRSPTTWMPLDILAIQRIYGAPVNTPLSGGQVFGFHSNIQGSIGKFFDFSQNLHPVVTLWDKGTNNSLDLSGFATTSTVDLHDGAFSSAAGLTNNIAIAYGTRIDTVVTGSGADSIVANDNGDVVLAGAGADQITGGSSNDHLYGAGTTAVTGDGADSISGGAGGDYLQGNAGDDLLDGGSGSDRIQGGQGNDNISGGGGNDSINGNLGNDLIDGGEGNDSLRGGQGGDNISGGAGNDILSGDLGSDQLSGGIGIDALTGGPDNDRFDFAGGDALFVTSGAQAGATDLITDFVDGIDLIHMGFGLPSMVLHGGSFDSFSAAAAVAQQMLNAQGGYLDIAALRVGNDSYVFYDTGSSQPLEAFKLQGFADPDMITVGDFA